MEKRPVVFPEEKHKRAWYKNIKEIAALPPRERYDKLFELHNEVSDRYIFNVSSMWRDESEQAASDGRTKAQVVAHIMAWEEWQIQVFEDPNRMGRLIDQMHLRKYYDRDTDSYHDFESVNEFNAYQQAKYEDTYRFPWRKLRVRAADTAMKLQSFFPQDPSGEWLNFLESTPLHTWKIAPRIKIDVPSGWYLWMVSLEHEDLEHRADIENPELIQYMRFS